MRQKPHVRICGGPGRAISPVYPTLASARQACPRRRSSDSLGGLPGLKAAGAGRESEEPRGS